MSMPKKNKPIEAIPTAVAYKCNGSHKFKDLVRGSIITIPSCPKCRELGMNPTYPKVLMLMPSIDDAPDVDLLEYIPAPEPKLAATTLPFNGDAHALLLAVLIDAGVRMGDGRIGREMCKGCETKLHAPGIKKCTCACHAGWAYIEYIERRPASKAA
jgi:hypothetical protein